MIRLISSSFHRLDMTLAVAEALNPNTKFRGVGWMHGRMGTLRLRGAEGLICPKFYT